MNKRSIILIVSLFVVVVVGMFTYAYLKKSEVVNNSNPLPAQEQIMPYANINRITAKQFFIDGVHTFVGDLEMPTPCDLVDVKSVVMESSPEQVRLDFKVINNAEDCMSIVTTQRFMVKASASAEAQISATFMGRSITLNLVPAAAGESPEDFELFIKG